MLTTRPLATAWNVDRDEVFFRLVQGLFPPAFLEAASGLLASYDDVVSSDQDFWLRWGPRLVAADS
ncbi:MAG: hypothetical protein QOE84_2833 [Actinomycetota bacterium]|jgi:hypothetical protein|nr:hypothetical protein [Actinomycetota bacterium]